MDQPKLIECIMQGIRREVEQLVGHQDLTTMTLEEAEISCREAAKKMGGMCFEGLIGAGLAAQRYGHVGPVVALEAGGRALFERYEERWVQTHLGRFRVRRAYYSGPRGGAIPLDEAWGLDEREPSPSLRQSLGMVAAEVPFERASRLMKQLTLLELPPKRFQESSEDLGQKIQAQREARSAGVPLRFDDPRAEIPSPAEDEKRGTLYLFMDGGRLQTTTGEWREPKVATLFWDDERVHVSHDRREILHKEYIATLGDADAIRDLLWEAATRWQFWRAKHIVFLGDGAPWIWKRAQELFPQATQILDCFHVEEHLWQVGRLLFGGTGNQKDKAGPPGNIVPLSAPDRRLRDWVTAQKAALDEGDVDAVLTELRRKKPGPADAKKARDDVIRYLEENRSRMNYKAYREAGFCIGSGAIESGIKNVVNQRMKGCGMRWNEIRAEHMLHLRAAHLSDIGPFAQLQAA